MTGLAAASSERAVGVTPQVRASGPGGSIYDLGYQGYEGPRLGREAAIRALFWHTRPVVLRDRARRAGQDRAVRAGGARRCCRRSSAVGIAALATQAGDVGELVEAASPIRYETYHGLISTFVMLFCAAQAPELLGRDQRYGVLPLYFSRALARLDYALAKVLGLVVVAAGDGRSRPYAVLFVGRVLVAPDPIDGPRRRAAEPAAAARPGAADERPARRDRDGRSRRSRRAAPMRRSGSSPCSSSRRSWSR